MQTRHPLAVWRDQQNPPMSQDDFARMVEVSRWTVNSIETRRRVPSHSLMSKIDGATKGNVPAAAFFGPAPKQGAAA